MSGRRSSGLNLATLATLATLAGVEQLLVAAGQLVL